MRRQTRVFVGTCAALAGLLLSLAGCSAIATIKPLATPTPQVGLAGAEGSSFRTGKGFNPVAYVDGVWASKILPTVDAEAQPLPDLLTALAKDKEAASAKYGHHEAGTPLNFIVKLEGQVTDVNTTSRVGLFTVKPTGYDGPATVQVQLGPVIRGTSIRDGVGFIKFNDFLNQIEYADAADEMNNRVLKEVLKNVDAKTLQGKNVSVSGMFTLDDDPNKILITPVKLTVKG